MAENFSSAHSTGKPEQPTPEQPAAEQPEAEQPAAEQPGAEQPAAEQPAAEQPAPEQPAPEQPAPEQPAPEQPAPEQPAPEQPTCASAPPVCEPKAEPEQNLLSGSRTSPADQWHFLQACLCKPEPGGLRTQSQTRTQRGRALLHRRFANLKPNPNPAAVCASAQPASEPEAKPQTGDGVHFRTAGLRTRTAPSQRRCNTPRGPEVSLSRSRPSPADLWHFLRVVCANPNPPVCEPEAEPEPGGGVRFRTAGQRT
jgi:hypothetical protein